MQHQVIEIMDKIAVRKEMKLNAVVAIQRWMRAYQKFVAGMYPCAELYLWARSSLNPKPFVREHKV